MEELLRIVKEDPQFPRWNQDDFDEVNKCLRGEEGEECENLALGLAQEYYAWLNLNLKLKFPIW